MVRTGSNLRDCNTRGNNELFVNDFRTNKGTTTHQHTNDTIVEILGTITQLPQESSKGTTTQGK